jgi:hypothetical protein
MNNQYRHIKRRKTPSGNERAIFGALLRAGLRPQYKRTEVRDMTGGIIAIQSDLVLTPQIQKALEELA